MSFPLALLALAAAALGACHQRGPGLVEEPVQRLEGFELSQSTLGSPAWDLTSRLAMLAEEDRRADLIEPQLSFYKKKKQVSRVSAAVGFVRTDTHDVRLSTRVVVRSLEDQTVLTTEELGFSSQRRKFFTDKDVLVRRPGGVLRGRGLEASPDLSDIRIFNQKTVIEPSR